jgi:hypothetical protein
MIKHLSYLLVVVAVACLAATALLMYVSPYSDWFLAVFVGFSIILFACFLRALFRKRWQEAAIYSLPTVLLTLSALGLKEPLEWLSMTGFRIHVSPTEEYLSRCKLITFLEDNKQQQVGECERIPTAGNTWILIVYDTTGELVLPIDQRTKEWKSAVSNLSVGRRLAEFQDHRSRVFGHYYAVGIGIEDEEG